MLLNFLISMMNCSLQQTTSNSTQIASEPAGLSLSLCTLYIYLLTYEVDEYFPEKEQQLPKW